MSLRNSYIADGKELGLSGQELREYVKECRLSDEQVETERRRLEAEVVKARLDAEVETERRRLEADAVKARFEAETFKARLDAESAESALKYRYEHELELKKLEVAISTSGTSVQAAHSHVNFSHGHTLKLPNFNENKDDLDAYLFRFERTCMMYEIHEDNWCMQLARLLDGKALEVYRRLPTDELENYSILKSELLKRFQLTEGGYRKRFKASQQEPGETSGQFTERLRRYLSKWRELSDLDDSYEGLEELIVKDHFFNNCSKELQIFIKERGKSSLAAMTKWADDYNDAHFREGEPKKKNYFQPNRDVEINEKNSKPDHTQRESHTKPNCMICGRIGHVAANCRSKGPVRPVSPRGKHCHECGSRDHIKPDCPKLRRWNVPVHKAAALSVSSNVGVIKKIANDTPAQGSRERECVGSHTNGDITLKCGCTMPVVASAWKESDAWKDLPRISNAPPMTRGLVNGVEVICMRDTGCSTIVCRTDLVKSEQFTGQKEACVLIDGVVKYFKTAIVPIDTVYFKGDVKAICMDNPIQGLIVGNISNVKSTPQLEMLLQEGYKPPVADCIQTAGVQTRATIEKESKPLKKLKVPDFVSELITTEKLKASQLEDPTLKKYLDCVGKENKNGIKAEFLKKNGLLYRRYKGEGNQTLQLIVPQNLRCRVMEVAHDSIMSGHLGTKKTQDRVTSNFYWPGVLTDVQRHCASCDECQRSVSKGSVGRAPLGKLPLIGTPYSTICVDLIGPITPASDRGHRYILTVIDMCTRFPDAVPLKSIDTNTVSEALLAIYSRVGIPRHLHTDNGSQFTSGMMAEVTRLLSIKHTFSTAYHPMGNGLVENCNKTLKSMLKKMASEVPRDWDRYLTPLLFAVRDVPQASTGFSPFELLYGRTVRGPMNILREMWTNDTDVDEIKTAYQYVIDLRARIEETCNLAQTELAKVQVKNQRYYNLKVKDRKLEVNDQVLLLLPTDKNKLLLHWKGPFRVVGKVGLVDYKVEFPTGKIKTFHINMLKKYNQRQDVELTAVSKPINLAAGIACVLEDESEESELDSSVKDSDTFVHYNVERKETFEDVKINPDLADQYKEEVRQLLIEFQDIFSDVPSVTSLAEHVIKLTQSEPVRSKIYPIPYKLEEVVSKEIDSMLALGIIEYSTAPYSAPIVMVRKSDGSNRVCINYKLLNKVTEFDPEPMMSANDIFPKLSGSKFYSKFDFCKGYWQIPMEEKSKDATTFITSRGIFRFRVMPFGLVNAGSSYNRMMRKLLDGTHNLESYLDDVLGHTVRWPEHVSILRDFFCRVRSANLTLKPSKCQIGFEKIEFLGHVLNKDSITPSADTIQKVLDAPRPITKKQIRSFNGLVNFYRSFIPNCSTLMAPLAALTGKKCHNIVEWTESHEKSFNKLKEILSKSPILKLVDLNKSFVLQTDASNVGIGAILLQEHDGVKHPVAYASKKLLDREQNYSVSERECLAIVWGLKKFHRFLYGQHFVLETDHRSLEYLNTSHSINPRLTRWSLALQPFRFTIKYIKGSENVGADYLSRM